MWPADPELAVRGGFLVCTTPAGHPIYRNPAAPHIIPLLPGLLALCQVLNGLSSPQALALLNEVSLTGRSRWGKFTNVEHLESKMTIIDSA